jgi:antitoxin ParD1/3/4
MAALTLSAELENLIREKVATGLYRDADDVMRRALEALSRDPKAREDALRAAIQLGFDDIEAGRYTTINSHEELIAFFENL